MLSTPAQACDLCTRGLPTLGGLDQAGISAHFGGGLRVGLFKRAHAPRPTPAQGSLSGGPLKESQRRRLSHVHHTCRHLPAQAAPEPARPARARARTELKSRTAPHAPHTAHSKAQYLSSLIRNGKVVLSETPNIPKPRMLSQHVRAGAQHPQRFTRRGTPQPKRCPAHVRNGDAPGAQTTEIHTSWPGPQLVLNPRHTSTKEARRNQSWRDGAGRSSRPTKQATRARTAQTQTVTARAPSKTV